MVGLSEDGIYGYRNQGGEVRVTLLTITQWATWKTSSSHNYNFRCIEVYRSLFLEAECFHLRMQESHYGCHQIMSWIFIPGDQ